MDQVLLPEAARREERRNFTEPFTLPGQCEGLTGDDR